MLRGGFWWAPGAREGYLWPCLLSACAVSLEVARHEGGRSHEITWIGVTIKIRWEDKLAFFEVPAKMIQEFLSELKSILEASMAGVRGPMSLAGRLSWISRVLPRLRWAVCLVYAVVSAVDKDMAKGIEEQRRRCRLDSRDKAALVVAPRCRRSGVFTVFLAVDV